MRKPELIALLTLLAIPLHAADVSDLSYDVIGDTVSITGCDTGASGTLIIPETIEGKPVTSIGVDAFFECEFLTSITIPEGVTSIGDWAFDECTRLNSITIGNGVTSIGDWAFYCCNDLNSITIPDSVTSIGEKAFEFCINLTSITIPEGVTSIKEKTFLDCWSLTNIIFLGNAPRLGFQAFHQVPANAKVYIYEGASGFGGKFGGFSVVVQKKPVPPKIISVVSSGDIIPMSSLTITFTSDIGSNYAIERSRDLVNWVTVVIIAGKETSTKFTDNEPINDGEGVYYRIREGQ